MALHLSKSRNVVSSIRSKLGFLAMMEQRYWSSEFTQKLHTSSPLIVQNLRDPDGFSCKTPTLLASHRWESTMAQNNFDSTENVSNSYFLIKSSILQNLLILRMHFCSLLMPKTDKWWHDNEFFFGILEQIVSFYTITLFLG